MRSWAARIEARCHSKAEELRPVSDHLCSGLTGSVSLRASVRIPLTPEDLAEGAQEHAAGTDQEEPDPDVFTFRDEKDRAHDEHGVSQQPDAEVDLGEASDEHAHGATLAPGELRHSRNVAVRLRPLTGCLVGSLVGRVMPTLP